jgi:GNAT superfamily N-acetyltransferase
MQEWQRGEFTISTDPRKLDLDTISRYLSQDSYWALGRPRVITEKAIRNSLAFGLYHAGGQIGFARVITDCATFAYLADVFLLPEWRGQGLGKWMMSVIAAHPELQGLKRWMLVTDDAHGLYAQFGFASLKTPETVMERL